jgi:hypothetical protein
VYEVCFFSIKNVKGLVMAELIHRNGQYTI